jgi:nucleotide-binding universal stress UspA family protein
MIQNIMVATDFSERSDRAVRRATLLARHTGASLTLIHVVDDDQPRRLIEAEQESALALLHQQAETLRAADGVDAKTRVVRGTAFGGIVEAARDEAPNLLVIGPHRRQLLRDMFVGTTAERTVRGAPCPVLMANASPVDVYRHVLLSTDLSLGSQRALNIAGSLRLAPQAAQSLLLVFGAPLLHLAMSYTISPDEQAHYVEEERKEAALRLSEFSAKLSIGHFDGVVRHERTTPAGEILAAADEIEADLIVVGTRGASGFTKLILGSVAEEVLRRARLDVLAVPPGSPP